MAKFILLYKGNATPPEEMSEEQGKTVMGQWDTWMQKAGKAIVDIGLPMDPKGTSVVDDGSSGQVAPLNGYTVIEAADMAAAKALTEGHPFLTDKTGEFSVDIYELLPMPGPQS